VTASGPARVGSAPGSIPELLGRFPDGSPATGTAGAAVTILLRAGTAEVETLLIERTNRPTDPASGQVAFPGGRVEDRDGSLVDTALRELQEEVGLGEADLAGSPRYVGTRNAVRFGLKVAVFAASLGSAGAAPTALSADEVAHVFWLPRSALGSTRRVARETGVGPRDVPATVYEGHVLWGFTRRVLRDFFELPTEDELGGPAFAPDPGRERPGDDEPTVRSVDGP
jgi:8-oxo-dGTP pyrophosphatase MutT (NUDIX family)